MILYLLKLTRLKNKSYSKQNNKKKLPNKSTVNKCALTRCASLYPESCIRSILKIMPKINHLMCKERILQIKWTFAHLFLKELMDSYPKMKLILKLNLLILTSIMNLLPDTLESLKLKLLIEKKHLEKIHPARFLLEMMTLRMFLNLEIILSLRMIKETDLIKKRKNR